MVIAHPYRLSHPPFSHPLLCIGGEQSKLSPSLAACQQEREGEQRKKKRRADISKILHLSGPMFSRAGIMRV